MNSEQQLAVAVLQVVAAFLLLVVTGIYVVLTWKMVQASKSTADASEKAAASAAVSVGLQRQTVAETSLSRRAMSEPVLAVTGGSIDWYARRATNARLEICNFGRGPAFAVKVLLAQDGTSWSTVLPGAIRPDATVRAEIVFDSDAISIGGASIEVSCLDIFGDEVCARQVAALDSSSSGLSIASEPRRAPETPVPPRSTAN